MILVDAGPLVAIFDPRDRWHSRCREILRAVRSPLATTLPVLTETFHMLTPASRGADNLRAFIMAEGLSVESIDSAELERTFELMEIYRDHPMDLADASLIVAAETLHTRRIFTIDRRDFETYRIRRGHRHYPVEIVG